VRFDCTAPLVVRGPSARTRMLHRQMVYTGSVGGAHAPTHFCTPSALHYTGVLGGAAMFRHGIKDAAHWRRLVLQPLRAQMRHQTPLNLQLAAGRGLVLGYDATHLRAVQRPSQSLCVVRSSSPQSPSDHAGSRASMRTSWVSMFQNVLVNSPGNDGGTRPVRTPSRWWHVAIASTPSHPKKSWNIGHTLSVVRATCTRETARQLAHSVNKLGALQHTSPSSQ
jgi:hypothetical protein